MENFSEILQLNSLVRHYCLDVTKLLTTSIAWETVNPDLTEREVARDSLLFSLSMCLRYLTELNRRINIEFGNQFFVDSSVLESFGLLNPEK